jgi:hypothetical protein
MFRLESARTGIILIVYRIKRSAVMEKLTFVRPRIPNTM